MLPLRRRILLLGFALAPLAIVARMREAAAACADRIHHYADDDGHRTFRERNRARRGSGARSVRISPAFRYTRHVRDDARSAAAIRSRNRRQRTSDRDVPRWRLQRHRHDHGGLRRRHDRTDRRAENLRRDRRSRPRLGDCEPADRSGKRRHKHRRGARAGHQRQSARRLARNVHRDGRHALAQPDGHQRQWCGHVSPDNQHSVHGDGQRRRARRPSTTTPPATGGAPTTPTTPASSGQASGSVTVNVAGSPQLTITAPTTPLSAGVPAAFTFVVTPATTNASPIRSVTVNWGDGTPTQDLGAITGSNQVFHTYGSTGSFTITATVTDSFGTSVPVSTSVVVNPRPQPVVTLTGPTTTPTAGTNTTFTGSVAPAANSGAVIQSVVDGLWRWHHPAARCDYRHDYRPAPRLPDFRDLHRDADRHRQQRRTWKISDDRVRATRDAVGGLAHLVAVSKRW